MFMCKYLFMYIYVFTTFIKIHIYIYIQYIIYINLMRFSKQKNQKCSTSSIFLSSCSSLELYFLVLESVAKVEPPRGRRCGC